MVVSGCVSQNSAKCLLDLVDYWFLERLIKGRSVTVGGGDQVNAFALGWGLTSVLFKNLLAVMASDRGEEADYLDYVLAVEQAVKLVRDGLRPRWTCSSFAGSSADKLGRIAVLAPSKCG